jgi:hypothetical protein
MKEEKTTTKTPAKRRGRPPKTITISNNVKDAVKSKATNETLKAEDPRSSQDVICNSVENNSKCPITKAKRAVGSLLSKFKKIF